MKAHGRSTGRRRPGRQLGKSMAIGAVACALLAAISVQAADRPSILILPLDMVDTSGETPSHAEEHEKRLLALAQYLSQALGEHGDYAIVDPAPIRATIEKARATQLLSVCNGCEIDLAKLVHADRVLIGGVDKVSTLIGSLRLSIVDVSTGQSVFSRVVGFRGDTEDAWQHAARFFVRDLEATAAQQR